MSRSASKNLMTVENIAIAFGSTLMKANVESQVINTFNSLFIHSRSGQVGLHLHVLIQHSADENRH